MLLQAWEKGKKILRIRAPGKNYFKGSRARPPEESMKKYPPLSVRLRESKNGRQIKRGRTVGKSIQRDTEEKSPREDGQGKRDKTLKLSLKDTGIS